MTRIIPLVLLLAALPLLAAAPARPYHLELEATPEAVFPYLGKFGTVDLHVSQGGVRGEALWLHGFSRNGAAAVTVVTPLARMYVDVQAAEIPTILAKMAGNSAGVERRAKPKRGPTLRGKFKGIDATRHRLMYGTNAWIDVWTTDVIPPNPQYRTLVNRILSGISPGTAAVANQLPGTPVYVEANFRRFQKVPLVRLKKLTFAAEDEADALTLGRFLVRASMLEKLWQ
jgi:hypothetical protein